jgi:hypothetical protein
MLMLKLEFKFQSKLWKLRKEGKYYANEIK